MRHDWLRRSNRIMSLKSSIGRWLRGSRSPSDGSGPQAVVSHVTPDIDAIRSELKYLQFEVSRLRSMVRHLSAATIRDFPLTRETNDSFDYQWRDMPDGDWIINRPELKEREPKLVLQYTQLAPEWFAGKRVLDAGCGSGRFSWAMASLGANVTSVDFSVAGVRHTQAACAEFGNRVQVFQHDLTKQLPPLEPFDLVWSFGVLHHTGDTYAAFRNISQLVKPDGNLFMMLYAEPDGSDIGTFDYYVEVEALRRATAGMTLDERLTYIKNVKGDDAGGWFDAASPGINDTYPYHEIITWLRQAGFGSIKRTMDHPNHHVIARRLVL
jgi:2-polyprenyl-3-methyl-5-hydroxy-6-metoxy-1,4-benzoquinol methylase